MRSHNCEQTVLVSFEIGQSINHYKANMLTAGATISVVCITTNTKTVMT